MRGERGDPLCLLGISPSMGRRAGAVWSEWGAGACLIVQRYGIKMAHSELERDSER